MCLFGLLSFPRTDFNENNRSDDFLIFFTLLDLHANQLVESTVGSSVQESFYQCKKRIMKLEKISVFNINYGRR